MKFTSKIGQLFNLTSNLKNPATWLTQYLGASDSTAGIQVTPQSALSVPEIWNAVNRVSGAISMLDLECWSSDENGTKKRMTKDPGVKAWGNPNDMQSTMQAVQKVMVDALLLGNGRMYIERNKQGQPINLIPLQATETQTVIVGGERWHCVNINSGTAHGSLEADEEGQMYKIRDEDVFYVMGLSLNGFWGENLISLARDTIGLSIAGGESAGTIFQNSGRPGMILSAPRGAFGTAEEAKAFLDNFNAAHSGIDNQGKTGLLQNGMEAMPINYPTMDTSHIGMRQFQRECAALLFILDSVIGDGAGNVYKSLTERQALFLTNCLGPWIKKIEQEANKKLLSGRAAAADCKYKLNIKPLFENDRDGLALYTSSLRQQQVLSGNDVRELHGFPKVEGLDDDYSAVGGSTNEADPSEEAAADPNKSIQTNSNESKE